MEVKHLIKFDGEGTLKGCCDVVIGGLLVKGLRVVEGKDGLFVTMPRQQGKDGLWYSTVLPINEEVETAIDSAVLKAYNDR